MMKKVSKFVIWFIYDIHFQSRVHKQSLKLFTLNWGYLCKQTLRKKEKKWMKMKIIWCINFYIVFQLSQPTENIYNVTTTPSCNMSKYVLGNFFLLNKKVSLLHFAILKIITVHLSYSSCFVCSLFHIHHM